MKISNGFNSAGVYQAYVHPCVINQQPHIVYPRGLKEQSPLLFQKLSQHYQQKGYRLKEDQRSINTSNKYKNQRRKWVPIVLFTASLLFDSSAIADTTDELQVSADLSQQQHIKLQLISEKLILKKILYSNDQIKKPVIQAELKSEKAKYIFNVLLSRYQKQQGDPDYIKQDLKEIANYYSGFPQTIKLIKDLEDKNWVLTFDSDDWMTTASGSALQVDKATVYFNTRSAAQLRLNNGCVGNPVCVASPADALLHELLHVQSMLVNSEEFISKGGMNNVVYPYQHEYHVIDKERALYSQMSVHDKNKRPQRREHSGRLIRAACATCIK